MLLERHIMHGDLGPADGGQKSGREVRNFHCC
jgi:hypothetical protein